MKTFDVKLYFDGVKTSDRGYLTDGEFDVWKDEKWKQFLNKYGY
jgi:predicted Zn-dependent protease